MTPPSGAPRVFDADLVGRDVLSDRDRRKILKNRAPPCLFLDKKSPTRLSVQRLAPVPNQAPPADRPDLAPDAVIAEIGERRAKALNRNFYGWAELPVEAAARDGRTVRPSPLPDNQWHADIVLPAEAEKERRQREKHAQALADNAGWRPRPD